MNPAQKMTQWGLSISMDRIDFQPIVCYSKSSLLSSNLSRGYLLLKKGEMMKKTFGTMLLAGMFTLSGCFHMSPNGPASVSFENRTYKTGFTEHCFRMDLTSMMICLLSTISNSKKSNTIPFTCFMQISDHIPPGRFIVMKKITKKRAFTILIRKIFYTNASSASNPLKLHSSL